jgi:hypothetical protein
MITETQAAATAAALRVAAQSYDGTVQQVRDELLARADEWHAAAAELPDYDGEGVIVMAVTVTKGMRLYHDRYGWCRVIRRLNDGLSLHCEAGDNPTGWYRNSMDLTSPVIVKASVRS